jgi:hypothetical protein
MSSRPAGTAASWLDDASRQATRSSALHEIMQQITGLGLELVDVCMTPPPAQ